MKGTNLTVSSESGRSVIVYSTNGRFSIRPGADPDRTESMLIDAEATAVDRMMGRSSGVRMNPAYTGPTLLEQTISHVLGERPRPSQSLFTTEAAAIAAAKDALARADALAGKQ